MRRVISVGFVGLVLAALNGCNILFPQPSETGSSKLIPFASEADLSDYFRSQIRSRNDAIPSFDLALDEALPVAAPSQDADGGEGGEAPPQPVSDDARFSGTTIQETGVDEADVVKTDGEHLYMLDAGAGGGSVLRIVRASPVEQLAALSETSIEGYGRDIYLRDDTVVAITTGGGTFVYLGDDGTEPGAGISVDLRQDGGTSSDGSSGDADGDLGGTADIAIGPPFGTDDYEYVRPFTVVTIIDVADRTSPAVSAVFHFDGTATSSRMIDGILHLVLANYQTYFYDVMPLLGEDDLALDDVDVDILLPGFERLLTDGTRSGGPLVSWENLYHPLDPDGFGVVTVVSLDTAAPDAPLSSVGIVAEPGLIYSSRSALYLTDTNYNFRGEQRTTTDIYKLAYDGASATPVATGSVPGRVLNQYSMGEHQDNLRVATTVDPVFFSTIGGFDRTEPVNAVYVLSQTDEDLAVVGRAEDIAPGETIQSARFVGNRGYLVTFRQIDPLFTLDLADPTDPRVVGELKVPGFSTFLTPMGEDHLLAVGQYVPPPGEFGPWGVQVSIFDVSDFANPVQRDNVVIGGASGGSYSEALWNPKAFTYFAERDVVALPVTVHGGFFIEDRPGVFDDDVAIADDGSQDTGDAIDAPPPPDSGSGTDSATGVSASDLIVPDSFEGVVVFQATPENGLVERGRVPTNFDAAGFYSPSFSRGVFIGEKVYAVTNLGVRVADLENMAVTDAELYYGDLPPAPEPPRPAPPSEPGDPIEPETPSEAPGPDGLGDDRQ